MGPDQTQLAVAAPALMWLGASLALQLSASDLFRQDMEDGTLRVLCAEHASLLPYVVSKAIVMALLSAGPVVLLCPVYYVLFAFQPAEAMAAAAIFFVGSAGLVIAAVVSAALTVGMRTSGVLGAGLSAPIIIPILIFGVGATERLTETQQIYSPELLIVLALTFFYSVIAPVFAVSALRYGLE